MRRIRRTLVCASTVALAAAGAARAQEADAPPALIAALEECRAMTEVAGKADCYDAAVDALLGEIESGELVAIEREEIERAREESFGLPTFRLPGIGLLAREEDERVEEAQNTTLHIVSFSETADGRLQFETETGQIWRQVEAQRVRLLPDPPVEAELRPGMGNTYFVSIGGRSAGRMRRER